MDIRNISISEYTYPLPDNRIALHPLARRDDSKLLVYKNGHISEDIYRHIAEYLPDNSLMVFNNTRVIEARLLFRKPSGGAIEIFCLEPGDEYSDPASAMAQQAGVVWKCMVGGAGKWKHGQALEKIIASPIGDIRLQATVRDKKPDYFVIEFSWSPAVLSFAELLHYAGQVPLPPYIKRAAEPEDRERYQTIYAAQDGSVAAPTAGLHFTPGIFETLEQKNIRRTELTLHVGAGTFKPVKTATLAGHDMHGEFFELNRAALEQLLAGAGKVCAVGTTSARTLESLYWMALKMILDGSPSQPQLPDLGQWEVYDRLQQEQKPVKEVLEYLLRWMTENKYEIIIGRTSLLIAPGYPWKMVDILATNFHQPQSTLLLLIAALVGPGWRSIYSYAMENDFRFLSYGDGCLIFRQAG